MFLDSHIEATEGWLEALIHRIYLDKLIVPAPAIDNINYETYVRSIFLQSLSFFLILLSSRHWTQKKIL